MVFINRPIKSSLSLTGDFIMNNPKENKKAKKFAPTNAHNKSSPSKNKIATDTKTGKADWFMAISIILP